MQSIDNYIVVNCRLCFDAKHIPCTESQWSELNKPRSERAFMQDIFPELPIEDRELLISATCNNCWNKLFPAEDE